MAWSSKRTRDSRYSTTHSWERVNAVEAGCDRGRTFFDTDRARGRKDASKAMGVRGVAGAVATGAVAGYVGTKAMEPVSSSARWRSAPTTASRSASFAGGRASSTRWLCF
jgi:hypothetical protein